MASTLYQIDAGRRWYCGPAAVAAITGQSFEDVRAALNMARGRRANCGVCRTDPEEVAGALRSFGMTATVRHAVGPVPTFRAWRARRRNPSPWAVVAVGRHFVALSGTTLVDNKHPEGVRVRDAGYDRRRVQVVVLAWPKQGGAR